MIELFRYIEQAYIRTSDTDDFIDAEDKTDFQNTLRKLAGESSNYSSIQVSANAFLDEHFSAAANNPIVWQKKYLEFYTKVLQMENPERDALDLLIRKTFNLEPNKLIHTDNFVQDTRRLNDSLIAVKVSSAFDKVSAANLVSMRQAINFITLVAEENPKLSTPEEVHKKLIRPIRIPNQFLKTDYVSQPPQPQDPAVPSDDSRRLQALIQKHDNLKTAYETLMSMQPDEMTVLEAKKPADKALLNGPNAARGEEQDQLVAPASEYILPGISAETFRTLSDDVKRVLADAASQVREASFPRIVAAVKKEWVSAANELLPQIIPKPAKVYQVGIHTFAVQEQPMVPTGDTTSKTAFDLLPPALPDFSKAITKPIGLGNLQIVRQELLGYEAAEISHIENVMESELFRRSSRRYESNEVTTSLETETTQMEERDLQSTDRNELAKETQKEAGSEKSNAQDQSTTSDYGKLVENKKSNYARTVTDRAVNSLTQRVRNERVERERKTYTEKTLHEFDNRKVDAKKIRGIYQWVDKKYKNRIMNYGKRLLYDVVLPEPAAFLIESLKKAQQPENFQLVKPIEPWGLPTDLDASNYIFWAKVYGVTGSVQPPPDDFATTIAEVKTDKVEKVREAYFFSSKLKIPDGFHAFSCYITRLTNSFLSEDSLPPNEKNTSLPHFEFYIGQNRTHFGSNTSPNPNIPYNKFSNEFYFMNNEEGELPLLFRTFSPVAQFGFAIGINCKRKPDALEKWQLKTFATLMEGYRRQYADYQDKLAKMQASIRNQMALLSNFENNPVIEQQELKKVFISLLMSEHFFQVYLPTPIPTMLPPNPQYYKKWGAMVAFFERAFEWENIMYTYYPYFWGRTDRWGELILIQDLNPQFEQFLKAGAARVVVPVRPGYEAAMAHYHETGTIWMGKTDIPDMFSDLYVSIIEEIKARNFAPGDEVCQAEWDVRLPTTLVMLKADEKLPEWTSKVNCVPPVV